MAQKTELLIFHTVFCFFSTLYRTQNMQTKRRKSIKFQITKIHCAKTSCRLIVWYSQMTILMRDDIFVARWLYSLFRRSNQTRSNAVHKLIFFAVYFPLVRVPRLCLDKSRERATKATVFFCSLLFGDVFTSRVPKHRSYNYRRMVSHIIRPHYVYRACTLCFHCIREKRKTKLSPYTRLRWTVYY